MALPPFDPYNTPFRSWSDAQRRRLFGDVSNARDAAIAVLQNIAGSSAAYDPYGPGGINPYGQYLTDYATDLLAKLRFAEDYGLGPYFTNGWDVSNDPDTYYATLMRALGLGGTTPTGSTGGFNPADILSEQFNRSLIDHLRRAYQDYLANKGGIPATLASLFADMNNNPQNFLSALVAVLNPSGNPFVNRARQGILENIIPAWNAYAAMNPSDTNFLEFVAKRLGYR